jgi:hypothetical protein
LLGIRIKKDLLNEVRKILKSSSEPREARLALRWFVRNSDKEGSFERSEKNPEVEQ